jgi:multidrug transporter EmrE-like cation transporter
MWYEKKQDYVLSISSWWVSRRFNFGNILFYLKAHQAFADNPSTVFAAMNMGVIILGSLGILVFKEKMSQRNYLGLAFALVSIVLIALSQIYV